MRILPVSLMTCLGFICLVGTANEQEKPAPDEPPELIVRVDDIGFCHGVNMALKRILDRGVCTSVSVIVTTPWLDEAVEMLRDHPEVSVGVHLVLNSEWREFRWGPVTPVSEVPSLVDEFGKFRGSRRELMAHRPRVDEVARELRAQIDLALRKGLRVSYCDYHMGAAVSTHEFQEVLEQLAAEYGIGISRYFGEIDTAAVYRATPEEKLDTALRIINELPDSGLHLMVIHPGSDTPEMAAMTDLNASGVQNMARHRQAEADVLCDPRFRKAITDRGLRLVGYEELRKRGLEHMKRPADADPYEEVVAAARAGALPGFEHSPHFDEQVKTYTFGPDVTVHINAPSPATFDPARPTRLAIYALPNGNTIAQTIGKQERPGADWHFFIQHIGAQTRRLREIVKDENLVVAYVEAGGRSWPAWRREHDNDGELIARLIDSVRAQLGDRVRRVVLAGHSGGGSLILGYLNHVEQIPDWIERIVFLDANYSYSDEQRHGDKLIEWLRRSPGHRLFVAAYDDREVLYEGKHIVGPTGGTWRATQRMLDRFRRDLSLVEEKREEFTRYRGLDGQVEIIRIDNPERKILHTVMVEKNGFIHAMTFGTDHEHKAGRFWGPPAYRRWIQAD